MRWTIGNKLLMSSLIVTVLMVVIGYLGIYGLGQFDISVREISHEQLILAEISRINSNLLIYRTKLDQYLATGNKAHIRTIEIMREEIDKSFSVIKKKEAREYKDILNEVILSYNSYNNMCDSIISIYKINPEDAGTISAKKIRLDSLLDNALLVKLRALRKLDEERISHLGELSHEVYSRSLWFIILLSLLLISVGVISSYFISRSIANPLKDMVNIVPRISKGEFDVRLDIKSKDEIGDLAKSFNQMTQDLEKTTVSRDSLLKEMTERKKAEMAVLESEYKHKTLLKNIPQKIFYKDLNSVYVLCNESYAADLKIKPDEIKGRTDYEFYPKELAEKYRADDKRIMQQGKLEEIEEEYIKDGQKFVVQTIKAPVKDEQGNVIGIFGIFWDITERKKIEEQQRQLMKDLEETNKIMVGRELKMIELKREVNKLSQELGRSAPYDLSTL